MKVISPMNDMLLRVLYVLAFGSDTRLPVCGRYIVHNLPVYTSTLDRRQNVYHDSHMNANALQQ